MTVETISRRERILGYGTGIFGLSVNAIAYLLVPLRAYEFGAGLAGIGLLVGTKALVESVLSVPIGAFMDRSGARRSLLIGTAGTALLAFGFMVAPWIGLLFVLQAVLGGFLALGWLGGQSYAAGMRGGDFRSYDTGKFGFTANLGQIAAPVLAGAVAGAYGTQAAFGVVVAFALVTFLLAWALPDAGREPTSPSKGSGFAAAAGLLRRRPIQVVMMLTFCRLWIPAVWSSFFPLYLVSTGSSPAVAGSVISVMAGSATVTSLFTGRIAKLGSRVVVTAAALGISCVGLALSPVLGTVPWAYFPAILVGFGQGLSLPMLITLTSEAAPPEVRSLALGLRSAVNQAAAAIAPATVGPLIAAAGLFVGFPAAAAVSGSLLVVATLLGRPGGTR